MTGCMCRLAGEELVFLIKTERDMEWIQANWVNITAVIGGVVTVASLLVKMTPSESDDAVLAKIISVLKALSLAK